MGYQTIIKSFKNRHLLVVGDLMLDEYIKGSVSRISPEAPVPVVVEQERFFTPGGASNVANNISSLGAKVTVVGRIGEDIQGDKLKSLLQQRSILTDGIIRDPQMTTILKTRIIAQHQQIVRLDREITINDDEQEYFYRQKMLPFLQQHFSKFHGVVISDYGKGMISASLVNDIVMMAKKKKIPVVVDPKVEHLKFYGQTSSMTPNRKEMETALRTMDPQTRKFYGIETTKLMTLNDIKKAGNGLLTFLGIDSLLVTLGEEGMCLFEKDKEPFHLPTRAQEVFDVSGAGDTVIALFTLCLSAGVKKKIAADIANHAAGIVVAKMGAASVTPQELLSAMKVKDKR